MQTPTRAASVCDAHFGDEGAQLKDDLQLRDYPREDLSPKSSTGGLAARGQQIQGEVVHTAIFPLCLKTGEWEGDVASPYVNIFPA